MKLQAKISGKKSDWPEVDPNDLKSWTFDLRPGGWIIAQNITTGERKRFYYHRVRQQFWAKLDGHDIYGERVPVSRSGAAGNSASDFTAQFPGKVRKVMVADGQSVAENTPLVMIEAMKMEFAIKSSHAGIVKKVLVEEGQQLTPGQKLLDFEDAKT